MAGGLHLGRDPCHALAPSSTAENSPGRRAGLLTLPQWGFERPTGLAFSRVSFY
jgi:hypothetical protein